MNSSRPLRTPRRQIPWPRITRDTALLGMGIMLTFNEAVIRSGPERPYLLMLFAGMMGLPVFLRQDEKGMRDEKGSIEPPPTPPTPPEVQ